jgi:6-phosphogluconolactonase
VLHFEGWDFHLLKKIATMNTNVFKDSNEVASAFAEFILKLSNEKQGNISIALSGGSTPKILFALLAKSYATSIDWSRVHLFWGDERCVAPTHDDSNYKMTNEQLISKINIPAENIHRILGENDPAEEAQRYAEEIKNIIPTEDGYPRFDLVMLGMGDDGHTLSIFPHQMELLKSTKVCEVATHPTSGQKRVTLTSVVANNATAIAFLVTGKNKAEKVFEIIKKQKDWALYPSSYILPSTAKSTLYWYLDEDAAALL